MNLDERVWERDHENLDPMDFFPFPNVRPQQEYAIRKAVEAFKHKKFVILEGPCGSGKSGIIVTLSRFYGSAHILTPLKVLQNQYSEDFPGESIAVKGKGNYICEKSRVELEKDLRDNPSMFEGMPEWQIQPKTCASGPCTKRGFKMDEKICRLQMTESASDVISFDGASAVDEFGHVVRFSGCPYQVAKSAARVSPIVIHNFDGFLYQNIVKDNAWKCRPFLAVDEAHNAESKLIGFHSISIPESDLMQGDHLMEVNSVREFINFFVDSRVYSYDEMSKFFDYEDKYFLTKDEVPTSHSRYSRARFLWAKAKFLLEELDQEKESKKISGHVDKIARIVDIFNYSQAHGLECEYEFELSEFKDIYTLKGSPLFAGAFINKLAAYGDRVMLASATILNHKIFCRSLGIKLEDAEFIQIESDFPVENRQIYKRFVGKMSYREKAQTMPKMVDTIIGMMRHFDDKKGVIHTHTFQIAEHIYDALRYTFPNRLLTVKQFEREHRFRAKDAMLEYHAASKHATVIIDPSCDQGVDLPDDLCRWQAIVKVPYPMMSRWMKRRMEMPGGNEWYAMQAALKFVQSYGRGNRHKDDQCEHYILDGNFEFFEKNCRKFNLLPDWIWEAFEKKLYKL